MYIYTGWWLQPLWTILVSWDYYSQYIYIWKNVPNHQPVYDSICDQHISNYDSTIFAGSKSRFRLLARRSPSGGLTFWRDIAGVVIGLAPCIEIGMYRIYHDISSIRDAMNFEMVILNYLKISEATKNWVIFGTFDPRMIDGCWLSHASPTKIIKHQSFVDKIMRSVSICWDSSWWDVEAPSQSSTASHLPQVSESPDAMRSERKSPKVISASSSIFRLGGCFGAILFSSIVVIMRKGRIHSSWSWSLNNRYIKNAATFVQDKCSMMERIFACSPV